MQKGHPQPLAPGLVGKAVYFAALCGPFSAVPQIAEIWFIDRSAHGVSLTTWLLFFFMSAIWLWYGISRRDRPLIISNGLWLIGEAIIIAGAIHYDFDVV